MRKATNSESRKVGGIVAQSLLSLQSDERLVSLFRAGDDFAFDTIVRRYSRPLLGYSRRFLGSDRAQDIVQQTFINAYQALKKDDNEMNLKPWLFRIACNQAINDFNSKAWDYEELGERAGRVAGGPAEIVEQQQQVGDLMGSIGKLPSRQQQAFLQREVTGRSYSEIADLMDEQVPAVRELIFRARTKLRDAVGLLVPISWIRSAMAGASGGSSDRVAALVASSSEVHAPVVQGLAALLAVGVVTAGVVVGNTDKAHQRADRGVNAQARSTDALTSESLLGSGSSLIDGGNKTGTSNRKSRSSNSSGGGESPSDGHGSGMGGVGFGPDDGSPAGDRQGEDLGAPPPGQHGGSSGDGGDNPGGGDPGSGGGDGSGDRSGDNPGLEPEDPSSGSGNDGPGGGSGGDNGSGGDSGGDGGGDSGGDQSDGHGSNSG